MYELRNQEEFKDAMSHIDKRFEVLSSEMRDEFQNLAAMIANGFADIEKRLDVRERVDTLETKVKKLESALNVQLWTRPEGESLNSVAKFGGAARI
jgi:chaperonin cofactor prefoldin